VRSPFAGLLKVTIETHELLFAEILPLDGTEGSLELKVPELVSNAMVEATLIRPVGEGRVLARGAVSLEIDRDLYRLNTDIAAPDNFKPNSQNTIEVTLTDIAGNPVEGEISVFFVDEAILDMTGFRTPDPVLFFTRSLSSAARFFDMYHLLLPVEDPIIARLAAGGGDGTGYFSPFQRNEELLSLFTTKVKTDSNGVASVVLNVPEYSGKGRLTVIAHSGKRFGLSTKPITVSRNFTLEPTLPLAVAPADEFQSALRIFLADGAKATSGRISITSTGPLTLKGIDIPENTSGASTTLGDEGNLYLDFSLAPKEDRTFTLNYEAIGAKGESSVGTAELIFNVQLEDEAFTLTKETVVRPTYPRDTQHLVGQLEDNTFTVSPDFSRYLAGTGELSITLAPGPEVALYGAYEFLSQYPYGCLEQTISRAWTFLAAGDLGLDLTEESMRQTQLGLTVAVRELSTMQLVTGGFSLWPGGRDEYLWGTVMAAHFLTLAKEKGDLPGSILEDSLARLKEYLSMNYIGGTGGTTYLLAIKSYALYVLALNGDYEASWINSISDREMGLTPSAKIFLAGAKALKAANSEPLKELSLSQDEWNYNTMNQFDSTLESYARNEALLLLMWTEVDPLAPQVRQLAASLSKRAADGFLYNTQENGFALLALSLYLKKSAAGLPYKAEILAHTGEVLLSLSSRSPGLLGSDKTKDYLEGPFTIQVEGEGRPWYYVNYGGVPLTAPEELSQGLELKKAISIKKGSVFSPVSWGKNVPLELEKGDLIYVEISLTKRDKGEIQNVVISDLFAGGLELEKTDSDIDGLHLEAREDRVIMVIPEMDQNNGVRIAYYLRAVTKGTFTLPPTGVEAMYQPEYKAILEGGKVIVK
jgi:uncharacterized protein YfaS (alpha-2-macroglobulin family)